MRRCRHRTGDGTDPLRFVIRRGLDLPLHGAPEQRIDRGRPIGSVALVADDYVGVHASPSVREGDRVALGQPLFEDRKNPGVPFTSPGSGIVAAIHRGERRALESIVVRLVGDAEITYRAHASSELARLAADSIREQLIASGQWTAFRTRPYGKVPPPDASPDAIFVNAMDTNPLAASPQVVVNAHRQDFADGMTVVCNMGGGRVFLCTDVGAEIPVPDHDRVELAQFAGPHPAGLVGTHIHCLRPVGSERTVWHVSYQDVVAIGRLFTTGRLWTERVVSLAGPLVGRPRLITARLGASTADLTHGELENADCRVISGSALAGRAASGTRGYLGRYHLQVCVLPEDRGSSAGGDRTRPAAYSYYRLLPSRSHLRSFTTSLHGHRRPMLPVDAFERVMPLDVLATPLLRALLVGDTETAEALGCLELEEEDLALCTFVCPGKIEYGALLRSTLAELDGGR